MKCKGVKVSVLMSVYNEEKFLAEAIDSVLNQTMKDFEIILVDDNSKDNTLKIAKSFSTKDNRIKVIKLKKNKYRSGGLNEALKHTRGEYIAFLDGDDLYNKDKLKIQSEFMDKNPKTDIVYGILRLFGEDNRFNTPIKVKGKNLKKILKKRAKENLKDIRVGEFLGLKGAFGSANMMIKRKIFKNCKFDAKLKRTQDYDLIFQMIGKEYKFTSLSGKALYYYRIHKNMSIKNHKEMNKNRDYILKKLKKGVYFK